MMNPELLKQVIKARLTKTISYTEYKPDGSSEVKTATVSPGDEFILALVDEIIKHIQTFAQITSTAPGSLVYNGSGGMVVGVGGGIPGPVTAALTGVPISGAITNILIPPGCIK